MTIANQIMSMKPGMELDEEIATVILDIIGTIDIEGELGQYRSYSSDPLAAINLWEFASRAFAPVALINYGDIPSQISHYCSIKDEEDEEAFVAVMTRNWMESLSKAFLLYYNNLYGDYDLQ
ncbi:hypothetical protein ASL14_26435 (plasmid) [Paenibacillus sp. IHB B 3084]|uniref:hypothetical protein n=1 Tax=Paenibacillus sp. IHB B 3084 TaxID=867076 RepID=UPI0007221231|nr:hypothetical protein [Paenibacillus sp. IHB B 3084]ALP39415.1 hypothetical protein ASL14_26435 [Paenibacillus sp. IHB B 3084]